MSPVALAPSVQRWRAVGTTAILRTSAGRLAEAVDAARSQIARIDAAANRFDPASDLSRVNAAGGRRTEVAPLTVQAMRLAVDAARVTRGAVDPTIGQELVSLGGDIATAGPPSDGGWPVRVADDHRDGDAGVTQDITIASGGLATSSLVPRRWYREGDPVHHIVDPRTGLPVTPRWRTASVAAADCAQANIAATAALVLGEDAPDWLNDQGLPARLVTAAGQVRVLNGWPP
jgi:thiamine biosynthesis lipoprotein ApbE